VTIPVFDPATDPGPVPSPCINICAMDETSGLCRGCLRTIDEIAIWSSASETDKRALWQILNLRRRRSAQQE